eukprot:502008-Rhodomonas_salina.3
MSVPREPQHNLLLLLGQDRRQLPPERIARIRGLGPRPALALGRVETLVVGADLRREVGVVAAALVVVVVVLVVEPEVVAVELAIVPAVVALGAPDPLRAHHLAVVLAPAFLRRLVLGALPVEHVVVVQRREDGLERAVLVEADTVAIAAYHSDIRHLLSLVPPAPVVGPRHLGAVAEGDVQVLDVLPSAGHGVVHVVGPGALVLHVLHVVARALVGHGHVAMVHRISLLVERRLILQIHSAVAAAAAVPGTNRPLASAHGLIALRAHVLEVASPVQPLHDHLLRERNAFIVAWARKELVAFALLIAEHESPLHVCDETHRVEVLGSARE